MNDQTPPPTLSPALIRGLVTRRSLMAGAAGLGAMALAACGSEGRSPGEGSDHLVRVPPRWTC